jgi:hypothetical protein
MSATKGRRRILYKTGEELGSHLELGGDDGPAGRTRRHQAAARDAVRPQPTEIETRPRPSLAPLHVFLHIY